MIIKYQTAFENESAVTVKKLQCSLGTGKINIHVRPTPATRDLISNLTHGKHLRRAIVRYNSDETSDNLLILTKVKSM